jgi:hypothetical protein
MIPADIGVLLATYKVQLVAGLVLVVALFLLLKAMARLLRFGVVLAAGAAVGGGAAYGLFRAGVPAQYAWWTAVGLTLIVLLLGMRKRR